MSLSCHINNITMTNTLQTIYSQILATVHQELDEERSRETTDETTQNKHQSTSTTLRILANGPPTVNNASCYFNHSFPRNTRGVFTSHLEYISHRNNIFACDHTWHWETVQLTTFVLQSFSQCLNWKHRARACLRVFLARMTNR